MISDAFLQVDPSMNFAGAVANSPVLPLNAISHSQIRDMGEGRQLYFVVTVIEAFASANATAALNFEITVYNDGGADTQFFKVGTTYLRAQLSVQNNQKVAGSQTKATQIILPVPPIWGAPNGIAADPAIRRGWKFMSVVGIPSDPSLAAPPASQVVFTAGKVSIDMALDFSDSLKTYPASTVMI